MTSPAPSTPRFSVFIATSLDGFIARSDGSVDWLASVHREGEDYGYAEFVAGIDSVLLGRKTYETALAFADWPYTEKRCYVLSHRALTPSHGEQRLEGTAQAVAQRLHALGAHSVYLDGGEAIRQFLAAGYVRELIVSIVPVVLGQGLPLFAGVETRETRLVCTGSRTFESGLVQLRYTPHATFPLT